MRKIRTSPAKNRTEPELKFHGSYSVLSLNDIVGTFTLFTVKRGIFTLLRLAKFKYQPNDN